MLSNHMLRFLFFLQLSIALVSNSTFAHESNNYTSSSHQAKLTLQERQWLAEHPDITLGHMEGFEPFLITNPDGSYTGMLVDLVNVINERLGTDFKATADTWPEIIRKVRAKEIDGVLSTVKNATNQLGLLHTKENLFSTPTIFTMANNTVQVNSLNDLIGKKVCIQEDSIYFRSLFKAIDSEVNYIECQTFLEGLTLVYEGKADAFIGLSTNNYLIHKYSLTGLKPTLVLTDKKAWSVMGIRKDYPELVTIINKALDTITDDEYQAMQAKWSKLEGVPHILNLTKEETEWLANHRTIRIGCDSNWKPIEFEDKNGEFKGATIDYLKTIAKILNLKIEIERNDNWQAQITKAKNKEIDVLTCLTKTPERENYLLFSEPYLTLPTSIFAKDDKSYISSLKELEGKTVAVVNQYAAQEWIENQNLNINLIPVDNTQEGLEKLHRNEIFAFVGNLVTTGYYLGEMKLTDIRVVGTLPHEYRVSFAVRNDWPILKSIIEKTLASIPQERKDAIHNEWMASKVRYEHTFDYTLLWQTIIIAAIIIIAIIYWNYQLGRAVHNRTMELEQSESKFRTLVSNMPGVSYRCQYNHNWTMEFISSEIKNISGYPEEDFLNNKVRSYASIIIPEDQKLVEDCVDEAIEKLESFCIEYRVKDAEGKIKWVSERGRGIYDKTNKIKWIDGVIFDITSQKEAELKTQKAEARYRLLYEATNDGVTLLNDNKIIKSNNRFFEMTGLASIDQLYGMNPAELAPEVQPDGRNSFDIVSEYAEIAKEKGSVRFEFLHKRQDTGSLYTLDVLLSAMEIDGEQIIQASVRDISERKKAEVLMKNYSAQLEAEVHDRTKELKHTTSKLIESEKMATIGQIAANVAHEINTPLGAIGTSNTTMLKNFQKILTDIDDNLKLYKDNNDIIDKIIERITQDQKEMSSRQVREYRERTTKKLAHLGIRDPENTAAFLSSIQIMEDYDEFTPLLKQANRDEVFDFIQKLANIFHGHKIIETAVLQSSRVVDALREYTISDSKQEKVYSNLADTLTTSLTLYNNKIKHGIDLNLKFGNAPKIRCYPHELSQVWSNLIDNAIQAMDNNGKLSISLQRVDNDIKISFTDSGPGIPAVIQDHIFEPLFTTRTQGSGSGLGLDIAKRIVERHNGTIEFETEDGVGTTFTVTLPVEQK